MTCSKCGRKVRGRPAASGICPQCRRGMTVTPTVPVDGSVERVDLPPIAELEGVATDGVAVP